MNREFLGPGCCAWLRLTMGGGSGVYVPDNERWPKHFRGMGIRIEDSVYVGAENPIVLSVEAVKEVEDIEALRR